MFTRSPQGGPAPVIDGVVVKKFAAAMTAEKQSACVVHTPYYINFASANPRIKHGSASIIREELERASKLGAKFLMTHLGSSKDVTPEVGKKMVVEGLLKALDGYTGTTVFCIENSAGAGSTIGAKFEDIGEIITAVEKENEKLKGVIGVCLDTCHAFSSGYDLRDVATVKKTMTEFDQHIGLDRLKLIHANDSKFELGAAKDRHEHIGQGKIGLDGFAAMLNNPTLNKVDWYLETESGGVKEDIALLKKLRS